MSTPEKPTLGDLPERLSKLWKSPVAEQVKKAAATYLAKALANVNEALAKLNAKKK